MMSIERAEQLKREWTDKYVVVQPDVPHLRRFRNLTGTVKTINMNCRALVEFDGPEDIGWYDIDLDHLQIVDAPRPKKKAAAEAPAAEKPAAAKKAPAKTAGKSPLELAREQAAGGGKPAAAQPAGKKLSPLELARQQAAGKKPEEAKPAVGKKLSPLEQARQQDAAKTAGESAPPEEVPAATPAPKTNDAGKKLSPLERARMQDAKKNS
jgi:hypothetical protein